MVLPGFQDAHLHALEAGMNESICLFPEEASFVEYERLARACADEWHDGDWVLAGGVYAAGLIESIALEGELPVDVLDRAVPDKPMLILDSVGHGAWVNSKALALADYDKFAKQPQGGLVHLDEVSGRPSGLVFENAYQQLQDLAWKPITWKLEESAIGLNLGLNALAKHGVTSVSDAGGYWPRGHDQVWQQLEQQGEMTVRAKNALYVYPDRPFEVQIEELKKRFSNDAETLVSFNHVKLYVDGIISYGTSALYEPYDVAPPGPLSAPLGFLYFEPDLLKRYAIELDKIGFQMHFHATGSRAVGLALDVIEAAQQANATQDRRHRITHLYQVAEKDLNRFKELGVIADLQISASNQDPNYLYDIKSFLGARAQRFLPLADLLDAGATVTLSTDWDAEALSPFESLQTALSRESQAVPSLELALKLKTLNTAYALHHEALTGSLEVGKYADLIVIDQNLFDTPINQISETRVLLTLLAGKEIYKAADF